MFIQSVVERCIWIRFVTVVNTVLYLRNAKTIVFLTTDFDFYANRVFNTINSIFAVWPSMSFIFQCIFRIIENNAFCWKVGGFHNWNRLSMENVVFENYAKYTILTGDSESTLRLFIYFFTNKSNEWVKIQSEMQAKTNKSIIQSRLLIRTDSITIMNWNWQHSEIE